MKTISAVTLLLFSSALLANTRLCTISFENEIAKDLESRRFFQIVTMNKDGLIGKGYKLNSMNDNYLADVFADLTYSSDKSELILQTYTSMQESGHRYTTRNIGLLNSVQNLIQQMQRCH